MMAPPPPGVSIYGPGQHLPPRSGRGEGRDSSTGRNWGGVCVKRGVCREGVWGGCGWDVCEEGCRAETTTHVARLQKSLRQKLSRSFVKFVSRALCDLLSAGIIVPHGPFLRKHTTTFGIQLVRWRRVKKQSVNSRECQDDKVQCVHCEVELAYHNSTTPMIQHLSRKHQDVNASSPSVADSFPLCIICFGWLITQNYFFYPINRLNNR